MVIGHGYIYVYVYVYVYYGYWLWLWLYIYTHIKLYILIRNIFIGACVAVPKFVRIPYACIAWKCSCSAI